MQKVLFLYQNPPIPAQQTDRAVAKDINPVQTVSEMLNKAKAVQTRQIRMHIHSIN